MHVHCIVTDGALSPDQQRWLRPPRRGFLFPTAALSKVFRGKYLDALASAHRNGEVHVRGANESDEGRAFDCLRTSLQSQDWVVYSKPPFADAGQVLAYLGRYTHKTAIGNHRLVDFDGEHVRFRWRDYADGNRRKVMRLEADEFIRRFLLHVLPRGFTSPACAITGCSPIATDPGSSPDAVRCLDKRRPNRRRRKPRRS